MFIFCMMFPNPQYPQLYSSKSSLVSQQYFLCSYIISIFFIHEIFCLFRPTPHVVLKLSLFMLLFLFMSYNRLHVLHLQPLCFICTVVFQLTFCDTIIWLYHVFTHIDSYPVYCSSVKSVCPYLFCTTHSWYHIWDTLLPPYKWFSSIHYTIFHAHHRVITFQSPFLFSWLFTCSKSIDAECSFLLYNNLHKLPKRKKSHL